MSTLQDVSNEAHACAGLYVVAVFLAAGEEMRFAAITTLDAFAIVRSCMDTAVSQQWPQSRPCCIIACKSKANWASLNRMSWMIICRETARSPVDVAVTGTERACTADAGRRLIQACSCGQNDKSYRAEEPFNRTMNRLMYTTFYYDPSPKDGGIKRWWPSSVCLSVPYLTLNR